MSPYRTLPAEQAPIARDPEQVKHWQSLRDRFAHLADDTIWPAPSEQPFQPLSLDTLAVSGDGRGALFSVGDTMWLLATDSMRATRLPPLPGPAAIAMLSDDCTRVAAVCPPGLYGCDLVSEPTSARGDREWYRVWPVSSEWTAEHRALSGDGRILVTADDSSLATVRVFDLDARALVYSFTADCDEGVAIHPNGRHIVCFGDSAQAMFYGQSGRQTVIQRTGGGAISPGGLLFIRNDLDRDGALVLHPLDASGDKLHVGVGRTFEAGFEIRTWRPLMRFSPGGGQALVEDAACTVRLVDLHGQTSRYLNAPMTMGSGILADETRVLTGPQPSDNGRFACPVGTLFDGERLVEPLGYLSVTRRDQELVPVGCTSLGFYGALDPDPQPLTGDPALPYERFEAIGGLLGALETERLSDEDQRLMDEVVERNRAWHGFYKHMTVDIRSRQLMGINRGLSFFTPEIVERALAAGAQSPRFGRPMLSLAALGAAGDELRAMSPVERTQVFSAMLDRLRAIYGQRPEPQPALVVDLDSASIQTAGSESRANINQPAPTFDVDADLDEFFEDSSDQAPSAMLAPPVQALEIASNADASQALTRRASPVTVPVVGLIAALISALASLWFLL